MRVLSLFSGVGGFDMGLEATGMTTVFQCEIDKHARAVLDYRWPDVPKWDDVSTLTGEYILEHTDGVDVVAWGSPCQDLSLAGKRAGLSGERSGLFHQGIRIIKELRELSNGKYPTWSVWENVVGALSSNGGADFGEVLYEMDEAGACFSEWAVLDAQYFGVPQRRRRVFVVSCFDSATADRCGDKILAVEQSGGGDSAKGKQTRQGSSIEVADGITAGSKSQSESLIENPIVFSHTQGLDAQPSEIHTPTLRSQGGGAAVGIMAFDGYNQSVTEDVYRALRIGINSGDCIMEPTMQVRRLTPIECERLMGWPDNHTSIGTTGPVSDTNRYKMCGNGVASPVAQWIGQHLMRITDSRSDTE